MATYSSILAWRIPWTEETGQLQSMLSQRVRHDWRTNTHWGTWRQWCLFFNRKWTLVSASTQNSNFFLTYSLIWIWYDDMDPIMVRNNDYEYEHLHTKDMWIQMSPHTLSIYPALSIFLNFFKSNFLSRISLLFFMKFSSFKTLFWKSSILLKHSFPINKNPFLWEIVFKEIRLLYPAFLLMLHLSFSHSLVSI